MIYSLFTNIGIWNLGFSIVQIGQLLFGQTEKALFQNLFLTYMSETGILWGFFEKDSQHIYKIIAIEKTSSTYTHKNSGLYPLSRAMFTVCLQKFCLADDPLT